MVMISGGFQSKGKMFEDQEVNVEMMEDRREGIGYFMGRTDENSFHHKIKFAKKLPCGNKQFPQGSSRAIALLKSWLAARENVTEEDLKKIWKGLFFCLSHAENHCVQEDLVENFISLFENLDLKLFQQYFTVFLLALRQAWPEISDLQLNKFHHLLRQLLRHMFIILNMSGWDSEPIKGFMEKLTEQTFLPIEECPSQGMNLYIADVYLSELQDFLPLQVETFVLLMEPFYAALEKASHDTLVRRIKTSMFDRLLKYGRNLIGLKQEGKYIDVELQNFGTIAVTMGATSRLFKLATTTTLQANKRVLSELHQEFSQLDMLLISSEISLHSPEGNKKKLDNNLCLDKSSEVSSFSSLTEKISNGVDGIFKKKTKAIVGSEIHKSQFQCKEPRGIVEEAATSNTCSVQEAVKEGEILNLESHLDPVQLDHSVVSNLEKQFEKFATEFEDCSSPLPSLVVSMSPLSNGSQKRKRVMSACKTTTANLSSLDTPVMSACKTTTANLSSLETPVMSACKENEERVSSVSREDTPRSKITGEKSVKKVTFVLKNNLVWKPSTPLPPHSLRVPSSATPRGSALKKGVPPGPISIIKQSPSPKKESASPKNITPRKRCTVARKSPRISKGTSPRTQPLWRAK